MAALNLKQTNKNTHKEVQGAQNQAGTDRLTDRSPPTPAMPERALVDSSSGGRRPSCYFPAKSERNRCIGKKGQFESHDRHLSFEMDALFLIVL